MKILARCVVTHMLLALISLWSFVYAVSDVDQRFQGKILYLWTGTCWFWGILGDQREADVVRSGPWTSLSPAQSCVQTLTVQAAGLCMEQSIDEAVTQALCQQFTQLFLLDVRDAENKNLGDSCLILEVIATEIWRSWVPFMLSLRMSRCDLIHIKNLRCEMGLCYASFVQNSSLVLIGCHQASEPVSQQEVTLDQNAMMYKDLPHLKRLMAF